MEGSVIELLRQQQSLRLSYLAYCSGQGESTVCETSVRLLMVDKLV